MHNLTFLQPSEDDVWQIMAPMFHAAGTNSVLIGIWSATCQIPLAAFDPATALDLIERHGVTHTLGVPAMVAAITELQLREPRDVSTLQVVAHGGSPIATEVIRRAQKAFPTAEFVHVYGATETSPLITGMRNEQLYLDEPRGRSCGQALIGVQVKIVDSDGKELPSGEVGEVVTKGPNIMLGYWYLYLVDRAKDMIVTGGENVYCSEVEEALYKHPAVLEAAVIGVPDGKWGEAVHAVVVLREAVSAEELIDFCRQHIAGYKLPKGITFSETELPKSGPGKILKRELRQPFWEGKESGIN
jgi:long-chain acyl-CoA synthetase